MSFRHLKPFYVVTKQWLSGSSKAKQWYFDQFVEKKAVDLFPSQPWTWNCPFLADPPLERVVSLLVVFLQDLKFQSAPSKRTRGKSMFRNFLRLGAVFVCATGVG